LLAYLSAYLVGLSVGLFVGLFVGELLTTDMVRDDASPAQLSTLLDREVVRISRSAIQCPSSTCNFAYFASSPDPVGKLRSHFNDFKVRDEEHESFFQKPSYVICSKVIASKTRKGLESLK
jgi:hypothetical protein